MDENSANREDVRDRPVADRMEWEKRCRRCGRCCFEKLEFAGRIYYTDVPCVFLNLRTRHCMVYERRHELCPDCTPLTESVLALGVLPGDCPYVQNIKNYVAPEPWPED